MKRVLILFLFILSFAIYAQDLENLKLENPRTYMHVPECNAFYTPYDPNALIPFNDGAGYKITQANLDNNFKSEAQRLWDHYGEEYFYDGRFVLTGIDMQDAVATKAKYLNYLEDLGLDASRIDLQVMSYPFAKITGLNRSSILAATNKVKYHLLPSKVRDFQKVYFKQKTFETLKSTAWIETIGLVMTGLNEGLTTPEKTALIGANIGLFYLYAKYKDSWLNWLFRPGSNKVIGFAKQVSLSIPFVVSYNLFGNVTDIAEFFSNSGLNQVFPALKDQIQMIIPFAAKTAILAGLWHRLVNTDILGGWYNSQKSLGSVAELKAFTTMEYSMRAFGVPFSLMFLYSALPGTQTLIDLGIGGAGTFNAGHITMLAYTAATVATFKAYKAATGKSLMDFFNALKTPKLLKTWQENFKKFTQKIKASFKKRTPSR